MDDQPAAERLMSRGSEPIPTRRTPRVFLASKSPRRRELLAQAGIAHEVLESGVDDGHLSPGAVDPGQWVAALAYLKAAAAAERRSQSGSSALLGEPEIVMGADTVVVDDGEIIGQPRDRADAERILNRLRNGTHDVLTGVALIELPSGRREIFTDKAEVVVGDVREDAINAYLDSGLWVGKAGAYNLAERLAAGWPITYTGDPGTIMGLPMQLLAGRLGAFARS